MVLCLAELELQSLHQNGWGGKICFIVKSMIFAENS